MSVSDSATSPCQVKKRIVLVALGKMKDARASDSGRKERRVFFLRRRAKPVPGAYVRVRWQICALLVIDVTKVQSRVLRHICLLKEETW